MVYLAAHPGEGHYLLHALDPSVVDERDPVASDPALDLYAPANGFREPPAESRYTPEFLARYRAAQRARVQRIDAEARARLARRRAARARWRAGGGVDDRRASIATDFMLVYRTDADPRCVDLSLDPSERDYGSLWGVRPDWINSGAVGFGRGVAGLARPGRVAARADRARPAHDAGAFISHTGDNCIFLSTPRRPRLLGTWRVERLELRATTTFSPVRARLQPAAAAIAEWLGR
jgi:hypothetical protein